MQETEEKTTDVFYRFRKRDILKENGLRRNGKGRIRMKRAYFNCILLDVTEQMEPVAHKMELVVCRGRAVHKPAPKRNKTVDALLDPYLA